MPRFENEAVKEQKKIEAENEKLKQKVFEQNQTMSDLLDLLFTHIPELNTI